MRVRSLAMYIYDLTNWWFLITILPPKVHVEFVQTFIVFHFAWRIHHFFLCAISCFLVLANFDLFFRHSEILSFTREFFLNPIWVIRVNLSVVCHWFRAARNIFRLSSFAFPCSSGKTQGNVAGREAQKVRHPKRSRGKTRSGNTDDGREAFPETHGREEEALRPARKARCLWWGCPEYASSLEKPSDGESRLSSLWAGANPWIRRRARSPQQRHRHRHQKWPNHIVLSWKELRPARSYVTGYDHQS